MKRKISASIQSPAFFFSASPLSPTRIWPITWIYYSKMKTSKCACVWSCFSNFQMKLDTNYISETLLLDSADCFCFPTDRYSAVASHNDLVWNKHASVIINNFSFLFNLKGFYYSRTQSLFQVRSERHKQLQRIQRPLNRQKYPATTSIFNRLSTVSSVRSQWVYLQKQQRSPARPNWY